MAKQETQTTGTDIAAEFDALLQAVTSTKPDPQIPTMSPEALELLGFDLEHRYSLAKVRAWLHTAEGKKALRDSRDKIAPESGGELTEAQRQMAERMRKRSAK